MAIIITDDIYYKAIADKIREKAGQSKEATYKPEAMPSGIDEVYTVGYDAGNDRGFQIGHEAGYEMGKQDGIQSEYDRFWDAYQQNGERIFYNGAFEGMGWNTETFQPKYNMLVDNANRMFAYSNFNGSLKDRFALCGVSMSLIGTAANVSSMFEGSGFTEIGELDLRNSRNSSAAVFMNSSNLVTIEKIILHSNQTTFSNWFKNCSALENIIFEGTINTNDFDIHWSTKLTHDSLMNIINCLADRTGQTAYTVTLGAENLAKLTDAEKAIATDQKNWTLA